MFEKQELPPWPDLVWTYADAQKAAPVFAPGRGMVQKYATALRSLSKAVGSILSANSPEKAEAILLDYTRAVNGWARSVAADMLKGLERDNERMFRNLARHMGMDMRMFLNNTATGEVIAKRIEANTELIKSIPREAAKKAGELAHQSLVAGLRSEETAKKLHELGGMTMRRARLIAHTETSKAYTALTQVRASSVGSEGYIWRTARDGATRPAHRAMEGKFIKWSQPPTLDGMTGHAGEFPNCRCHPEPVIPRTDGTKRAFFKGLPTQEEEKRGGEKLFKSQWEKLAGNDPENTVPIIPHKSGEPLFNVDRALFIPAKLTGYSLNPNHSSGKDKARVWAATIGAGPRDAGEIERQVMMSLHRYPAVPEGAPQEFGEKFTVMVPVTGPNGKTVDVLTAWIYDKNRSGTAYSTVPRLTTIYVPPESIAR